LAVIKISLTFDPGHFRRGTLAIHGIGAIDEESDVLGKARSTMVTVE